MKFTRIAYNQHTRMGTNKLGIYIYNLCIICVVKNVCVFYMSLKNGKIYRNN